MVADEGKRNKGNNLKPGSHNLTAEDDSGDENNLSVSLSVPPQKRSPYRLEVDTKNQTFKAEVIIEARWYEPYLQSYVEKSSFESYSGHLWDPKLVVVNLEAVQAGVDEVTESIKIDKDDRPYIHYTRRIRGVFFEKMELFEFPRDVQDLSVTVMSELSSDEIELLEDTVLRSSLKSEMFQDENFYLFEHVEISPNVIPDPTKQTNFSMPIISATCRVARNPMFFIWNNYLIMTCLVFISLCTFSIDPKEVKYRLSVILTILLTSVTFKLSTAGKLPMISYNTLLDIYILTNMVILMAITMEISILSLWKESPHAAAMDRYSVEVITVFLVVYHIIYWVMFVKITRKRYVKIRRLVSEAASKDNGKPVQPVFERKGFLKCMKVHSGLEYVREFVNDRIPNVGVEEGAGKPETKVQLPGNGHVGIQVSSFDGEVTVSPAQLQEKLSVKRRASNNHSD